MQEYHYRWTQSRKTIARAPARRMAAVPRLLEIDLGSAVRDEERMAALLFRRLLLERSESRHQQGQDVEHERRGESAYRRREQRPETLACQAATDPDLRALQPSVRGAFQQYGGARPTLLLDDVLV
ncbi:MAG TPA: hypothetical protein VFN64_11535 [Burkholderiaceae bacterium]|nr:hypothetical protein [Burkholderiaceae bacterium]